MAAGMSDSLAMRFLRYYLLGEPNGYDTLSTIISFQMGVNNWQYTENWPQSGFTETNLYLHDNMMLNDIVPTGSAAGKQITYDPRDPSPTVGGPTLRADMVQGPYDQAPVVESRSDVLVFTTPILESDATVQGYPKVILQIKSDCKDTDFAARLTDVYPDGRSMLLVDGIRRVRFREGFTTSDTTFMSDSSAVYVVEIELNPTSHTFLAGHRIRLDITSSNYPRFNNNINDGGPMYVSGDTTVAHNRVMCNGISPSMLVLPVDIIDVGMEKSTLPILSVYPNPCSDELSITIPAEMRNNFVRISVFDVNGKKVSESWQIVYIKAETNTSQLQAGMYNIQIQCGMQTVTTSFIKK
ncbi:hypothetical protein DSECCO2_634760 [anaerobic digester metagenome]